MSSEILKSFLKVYKPFSFDTLRIVFEQLQENWKVVESYPVHLQDFTDATNAKIVAKFEYCPTAKKRCFSNISHTGDIAHPSNSDTSDFDKKVDEIIEKTEKLDIKQYPTAEAAIAAAKEAAADNPKEEYITLDDDYFSEPEIVKKFYTFYSESYDTQVCAKNIEDALEKIGRNFSREMRQSLSFTFD
jgi:hypothetical protein